MARAKVVYDPDPSGRDWVWFCRTGSCPVGGDVHTHATAMEAATHHMRTEHEPLRAPRGARVEKLAAVLEREGMVAHSWRCTTQCLCAVSLAQIILDELA